MVARRNDSTVELQAGGAEAAVAGDQGAEQVAPDPGQLGEVEHDERVSVLRQCFDIVVKGMSIGCAIRLPGHVNDRDAFLDLVCEFHSDPPDGFAATR
ncbi:TPA: hypothetical protein DCE37_05555 [Candidatus Latescibacteria bacterium]|nr:hypothetical protein [Candidatus Latescibacterota bacterium]